MSLNLVNKNLSVENISMLILRRIKTTRKSRSTLKYSRK